ncbi:MAG: hypothetical protein V1811_02630 [Candidatus Micrarchaeota archaeon]
MRIEKRIRIASEKIDKHKNAIDDFQAEINLLKRKPGWRNNPEIKKNIAGFRVAGEKHGEELLKKIGYLGEIGHLHHSSVDALEKIWKKTPAGYTQRVAAAVKKAHEQICINAPKNARKPEEEKEFNAKLSKLSKLVGKPNPNAKPQPNALQLLLHRWKKR